MRDVRLAGTCLRALDPPLNGDLLWQMVGAGATERGQYAYSAASISAISLDVNWFDSWGGVEPNGGFR